jgi:hypothetical protein
MSNDETKDAAENQPPRGAVSVKAFVDRIEEGLAVILLSEGDGQFDAPLRILPPETKAGDHLIITFQLDPESRAETLRNISELTRRLTEDSDPQQTDFKL